MTLSCRAILFDMDGVLVDSRAVVERTWRRWAERHALDPGPVLSVAHGRRTSDTLRAVFPHLDATREVAWLDATELEDLEGLAAVPGAMELLATLPADVWAIVTSAGPDLAALRLRAAGLPTPRVLVSSTDIQRGKPAPDGYLLGARRLGVAARDCVVFEDAPPGIAAARAARARVIALTTTHDAAQLGGAEALIRDLRPVRVRQCESALLLTFAHGAAI